jgi:hypothetical protein
MTNLVALAGSFQRASAVSTVEIEFNGGSEGAESISTLSRAY